MASDILDCGHGLTADNLCKAVRHFLRQIAENPEQPVDRERGLVLYGVPGDDEMRTLMELFGGELRITVREMPAEMESSFRVLGIAEEPAGNVWSVKEPAGS